MRLIRRTELVTEEVQFYNLDNNRNDKQVETEIRALLEEEPLVLGMCETIGNTLPLVSGYWRIQDKTNKSRANIGAYIRKGVPVGEPRWAQHTETWGRTQAKGIHEARATLYIDVDGVQTVIGHVPPKVAGIKAQQEAINIFVRIMAPWKLPKRVGLVRRIRRRRKPRLCIADFNRRRDEPGPGPSQLATRIKGWVLSNRIDTAVFRRLRASNPRYIHQVNGVKLLSDHHHALQFSITYRRKRG
jgi:hypothetical protein